MAVESLGTVRIYSVDVATGTMFLIVDVHGLFRDDGTEVIGVTSFGCTVPVDARPKVINRAILDGAIADAAGRGVVLSSSDILHLAVDRG